MPPVGVAPYEANGLDSSGILREDSRIIVWSQPRLPVPATSTPSGINRQATAVSFEYLCVPRWLTRGSGQLPSSLTTIRYDMM